MPTLYQVNTFSSLQHMLTNPPPFPFTIQVGLSEPVLVADLPALYAIRAGIRIAASLTRIYDGGDIPPANRDYHAKILEYVAN